MNRDATTEHTPSNGGMRWNEERYRTLFDMGPVAVYSCDAAGVIQEFNRRAVELWGCEPVLGDTDKRFCGSFKLFRPDGTFMPHEQCPMADVVTGALPGASDAEVHIERPDGSRITVVVNIRPIKNERGDVIGAINCFYDITSRKATEEALRAREAELALVLHQTPFMLTRCSRDLRYQFVSQTYAEMMGCQPADIEGKAVVEIIGGKGFEAIRPYIEAVLQGRRVEFERAIPYDGAGTRSVRAVYVPDTDDRGRVRGWIASILDVSDRVRADEERARLLASEQAARAQAEEANRGKDQFLATVSHELRTPLNAILGWAAILERTSSPDPRTLRGLQSIHRNTRTLAQLVDDLLDVSRMISGKMRIDVVPMDVGDVLDAAVETVLPAATAKDISIGVVVDPAARTMTGDPMRLQQAVGNVLSNAVKFTPPGGRVEVSARVTNGEIELSVSDTGIGIEATFLPFVFDRFRQADSSSTRAQTGLGLGLAIVRHLVELHGGTVRAESDGRDAGTRFVMQLPRRHSAVIVRDARKPVNAGAGAPIDVPRLDGLRILIVDDDSESCEVMLEALRGYGATLRAAMSARDAVEALSEFTPDLVLSDIAMPDRDGYAVLSEVRARETTFGRRVPVAAVTANAHAEDHARAIAAGFDQYLAKPVEPVALALAVAALAALNNQ
jgi:PAS domain S-box-containing protein